MRSPAQFFPILFLLFLFPALATAVTPVQIPPENFALLECPNNIEGPSPIFLSLGNVDTTPVDKKVGLAILEGGGSWPSAGRFSPFAFVGWVWVLVGFAALVILRSKKWD